MSKWFSAASKAAALIAFSILAGCGRVGDGNDGADAGSSSTGVLTRPDTSVADIATAEPGKDRRQWTAMNDATRSVAGNLTASVENRGGPLMLAFANGITIAAERDVRVAASERAAPGAETFANMLDADPEAGVFLYRVTNEDLSKSAGQGGLCKDAPTTHVAVTEYVGEDGEWKFKVAAFKNTSPPGPGATSDPGFCAAYQYALP